MKIVKAKPNEVLLVFKKGKIKNLGLGATVLLGNFQNYAKVPLRAREIDFDIRQTSVEGITLRLKGIITFKFVNVDKAIQYFDFSSDDNLQESSGLAAAAALINDFARGELRQIIAQSKMADVLQDRQSVSYQLAGILKGSSAKKGPFDQYGIEIDLVQLSQSFIDSDELYGEIQAETRDLYRKKDELSKLETSSELEKSKIETEKALMEKRNGLEVRRQQQKHEQEIARIRQEKEITRMELDLQEQKEALQTKRVDQRLYEKQRLFRYEKEMMVLEALPGITGSLSGIFANARLNFGSAGSSLLLDSLTDIIEELGSVVKLKNEKDFDEEDQEEV